MTQFARTVRLPTGFVVLGLMLLAAALPAAGQPAPTTAPAIAPALRPEVQPLRPIFMPNSPIRIRFTLINPADEAITLPAEQAEQTDGIVLPTAVVLGTPDNRAVTLVRDDDATLQITPPALAESEGDPPAGQPLRLGPHGSVGTELDLAPLDTGLRYPGRYRLEWRPLDGQLGVATTEFRIETRKDAIIVTDLGKITITLAYDQAPLNVDNFVGLVEGGFYNGKSFHRVLTGAVIQGGCPRGDGTGMRPDGRTVPAEFHDVPVELGTVGMSRRPDEPNSASCQFFIALDRLERLDRQYTVIGQARDEESLRTLRQLAQLPTDRYGRPRDPVIIRSINLVEADASRVRHLGSLQKAPATP